MKKFVLISLVFLLGACATTRYYSVDTDFIDFKTYSDKGFFISTGYTDNYKPMGLIAVVVNSGFDSNKTELEKGVNGINHAVKVVKNATIADAIEQCYLKSIMLGANGLINVRIEKTNTSVYIRGMAVSLID